MHLYKYGLQASLALGLALVGLGANAAGNIQGQQFQDWGGNCEVTNNQRLCYLEQVLRQGNEVAMVSVLGYEPGATMPRIVFQLPANIHWQANFSLYIEGGAPKRFQGRCQPNRCLAGFELDQAMLQRFQRGKSATLAYTPKKGQKPVQRPISLMGVTEGLRALR